MAARYAELVKSTGLTQGQLAELLGVRRECISKRCNETGNQVVTLEAMHALRWVASIHGKPKPEDDLLEGL